MNSGKKILLYGYGNTTRRDDRLGIECVEQLEEWILVNQVDGIHCKTSPQLTIEDAEEMSMYDVVLLIDATVDAVGRIKFSEVTGNENPTFTTHTVSPSILRAAARQLFDGNPQIYLLQIQGYEWGFSECLTKRGAENLQSAVKFLKRKIIDFQRWEETV